jgi:predicted Rdx family selenoprotein
VKKAARLAESILHDYYQQLPGGVTLLPGSGGVFEVTLLDGGKRTLFSKEVVGRFPEDGEVEGKLAKIFDVA